MFRPRKVSYEMMPNGEMDLAVRESRREQEGAKEMETEKEKPNKRTNSGHLFLNPRGAHVSHLKDSLFFLFSCACVEHCIFFFFLFYYDTHNGE